MPLIRRQRLDRAKTPTWEANRALGVALGRACIADAEFRDALTEGFTHAQREFAAGRRANAEAIRSELAAAEATMRAAHVPEIVAHSRSVVDLKTEVPMPTKKKVAKKPTRTVKTPKAGAPKVAKRRAKK